MPKGYQLHPGDPCASLDGIRPLTTKERSRIQTFPASFAFSGSKTDQEQMIGNAVPVNLARFVGAAIQDYITRQSNLRVSLAMQNVSMTMYGEKKTGRNNVACPGLKTSNMN